jgi:outer membrane protein assembly factor BamA
LSRTWAVEAAVAYEEVDADSTSTANNDAPDGQIEDGDTIDYDDLPPEIQAGIGVTPRTIARLDLQLDSRSEATVAGSPVSGFWGRLQAEHFFQGTESFSAANVDLRGYRGLAGGVLAARLRLAAVGEKAAFYDRLYLGGMYTVRGFPTNALSAPGGDTWMWTASAELRGPIIGHGRSARLGGVLFIDTGASGCCGFAPFDEVSAGAGFGMRLRFWWLGWLGLDVGFPLTESPVDEAFHVNATLGWSF